MTPHDEAVPAALRAEVLTRVLLAHEEEGKVLHELQRAVGADDRDLLREARERHWASEEAAFRKTMRRWNLLFGIVAYLVVIAIWIEAYLLGRFPLHH